MYGWIWRRLPGSGPAKIGTAVGLIVVCVAMLWFVVFPWIEPQIQFDQGVVHNGPSAPAGTATPLGDR